MISKQFLYYSTKEEFLIDSGYNNNPNQEPNLDTYGEIYGSSIAYIADSKEIWTHGVFYKCDISASEVEELINSGKIEPAALKPIVSGAASIGTSTKYAREDHIHPAQTTITGNAGTATKLSSTRAFALTGAVTGSVSSDLSTGISMATTLSDIDASKITSGTIDIERLPKGALERLFVCDTEASALSTNVEEGDVVQIVQNNNKMYFCISSDATTFIAKFKEFTAGTATSVPWSGVVDKPTSFTPSQHSHSSNEILQLTDYNEGKSGDKLLKTDSLNTALKKLEVKADSSIRYDITQTLSNDNKELALSNIGLDTIILSFSKLGLTEENSYISTISKNLFDKIYNASHIIIPDFPYASNNSTNLIPDSSISITLDKWDKSENALMDNNTRGKSALFAAYSLFGKSSVDNPSVSGLQIWGPYDGAYGIQIYTMPWDNATKDWVTSQGYLTKTGTIDNAISITANIIKRGIRPSETKKKSFSVYFVHKEQITTNATTGVSHGDFLVLNTYSDPTGGSVNALFVPKNGKIMNPILYYGNMTSSDPWTERGTLAFISDVPTKTSQLTNDNNFLTSIPVATNSDYGGIKLGFTSDNAQRTYGVQLNESGLAYVNIPWENTTYKAGTNISINENTISCALDKNNICSALGYTPADTTDIPEIPNALPNPFALTINGISYTGSSAKSITTPKILIKTTLNNSTVNAGYSYNNDSARTISTLSGFSVDNPDAAIISTAKLTFTATNAIKINGLDDLVLSNANEYYIYCLSYMANDKVAINCAVYTS